jgi:uncharacterized membrane protein YozB (DUF420 family)
MQGFLGTNASLVPDIVVVAMFLVLPAFFYGAWIAKQGKTKAHAKLMTGVFGLLFIVIIGFVAWNQIANDYKVKWVDTDFYRNVFTPFVIGHIIIAVLGLFLGIFVVATAIKWRTPKADGQLVFKSSKHRSIHVWCGRIALLLFVLIAVTGFGIYYLRYVYLYTA